MIVGKTPAYSSLLSIGLPGRKANTFADILVSRAETHVDRRAYIFLRDGEDEDATLTFGQLHQRALAVAEKLVSCGKPGDRVVLLYPPGLEFIVGFFGCIYAGLVPVPVSVPNRKRGFEIVRGVALDSGACCILSSGALLSKFKEAFASEPALVSLPRFNTEEWSALPGSGLLTLPRYPSDTALLQYTSGSTGTPRGVVVSHANLIDNHRQLEQNFGHDEQTVIVSWLPMFHDMGLGNVLGALWAAVPCVLMSPGAFLQKPVRWLRAISTYRGTSSGGPDFAYDLCVRRISPEERSGLDLSSWRMAYNGSEPVRAATLSRFTEAFSPSGFRRQAFHAVYGLAEATLFVSGEDAREGPIVRTFSREGLEQGAATPDTTGIGQALVSCGTAWLDGRIKIVNPETQKGVGAGQIGEIWVGGPSVAAGYWHKPKETAETFQARTADGEGPFLRTGDLGFLDEGRLFVTGRSKDLIIVRGRNHYPQDIEVAVSDCHPAIEPLACAAFSVESDDGEQLVIAQEVKRTAVYRLSADEVFLAIRSVVSDRHGLHTHAIVLLSPGTLPRTTSGKVRRKACKQAFLSQSLSVLAASVFGAESVQANVEVDSKGEARAIPVIPGRGAAHPAGAAERTGRGELVARGADPLIEWLRRYGDRSNEPQANDALRAMSPSLMLDFAQQGLFGMQVGAQYGGLGLGHSETVRVLEQLAAIDLNAGLFVGLNNYLGVGPIARHAQPRLKELILSRLARGGELAAFAFAEPDAGSNPDALAAYAEPINGSGWCLFGSKYASGGMAGAGVINVFTRHRDRDGVSAFVVPQNTNGLRRSTKALAHGTQGLARNHIVLDGVALGNDHVLGSPGQGLAIALEAMGHSRLAVAAACLGAMKRGAQLLFHYATQRQTATGRLVAHPVTLAKLGRVTAGVTALECLVQQLARAADSGLSVPAEAFTVCKVAAPDMLWQVVDDLVQLLGRRGYVETAPIQHLVSDAQALRSCEGPTEAMSALLGARLMRGGEEAVRALAENVLGAQNVAPLIGKAIGAVRARMKKSSAGSPRDAIYWSHARAGELTTWIALLAAVEGRRQAAPSAELERASVWARASFERTLASIESDSSSEAADQDAVITDSVAAYGRSIGQVDPLLLWDEQALHPLMSPRHTEASVPPPPSDPDRTLEAEGRSVSGGVPTIGLGSEPASLEAGRELRAWIVPWLAQRLRVAESQIDPHRSFADHGLDSLAAIELAKALSDRLGRVLDETLLWNFATIDALVEHLEGAAAAPETRRSVRPRAAPPLAPASSAPTQASLEDEMARLERELKQR